MSGRVELVETTEQPLSVAAAIEAVADRVAGGLGIFAGVVRDHDDGRSVTRLSYEAHPSALEDLRALCERAAARDGVTAVAVQHRVGTLEIGELAVVVAVSAPHRAAALETTRWLIDALKREIPIWKKQEYADGDPEWLGAC